MTTGRMNSKPPPSKGLSLEPAEAPPAGGDALRTVGDAPRAAGGESSADARARGLRIATSDEFLAQAANEYEEGRIDSALWRWAADQGDNASLVIAAYLRARATALQLQRKQGRRPQTQAATTGSKLGASEHAESGLRPKNEATETAYTRARGLKPRFKYLVAGAAALVSLVTVVWLIALPRQGEPVRQPNVSAGPPSPKQSPAPMQPAGEQSVGVANQASPRPAFETRVQELKKAGNWHVLVLYANDWTRKEPNNAAAWYELSIGYIKLRQLDDAFQAATKAVQLLPEEASLWRNLGHVNLALERLPEAEIAFDRALALSSDDSDALCGAALVAQRQGRPNDADALRKRLKSEDGGCGVSGAGSIGR